MDIIATTAYNAIEQMLHDENEKPRPLPLSILESITDNFSAKKELGRGGFAVVYKGELESGMVAVKKLHETVDLDEKQFIKEIKCLMKVRHKNIVRFLGYCADSQGLLVENLEGKSVIADVRNRALCFEYVPKGSLDKHITDASCGLEWKVRYKIIKGICEGLHYLHENHTLHLDLKPANILLDDNMVPKIADFGLAKHLDQTQSTVVGTAIMGTLGYFPPECYSKKFSYKSDVYSLGVVIMEILSGEKFPTAEEVVESWRNRLERGQEDIPLEQVKACVDIGIMCTNHIAKRRPTTQCILEIFKDLGTDDFSASEQMDDETSSGYDVLERILLDESEGPKKLPLSFLQAITNNFSKERELGRGGMAVVYKGVLGTRTVAVKKLYRTIDIDEQQFNNMVQLLTMTRHKNILRFLGYCAHKKGKAAEFGGKSIMAGADAQNRTLCFEYLPNGSISNYITAASCGLGWRVRYQMIIGICYGLHYLHKNSICHLDLEPANILVDNEMVPKITDFGLSRLLDRNKSTVVPTTLIRKIGYWAPEGQITSKSDIYSLGVVIMEILTGERRFSTEKEVLNIWQAQLLSHEYVEHESEVRTCAQIGMKCMDTNPEKRPTTRWIIEEFIFKDSSLAQMHDELISYVEKNLGYCAGKPVAAVVIYKCLLHWMSFEVEKTSVFDRLLQLIGSAIENEEDNDNLAYWLSNTSTLLFLLHNGLKPAGDVHGSVSRKKPPQPTSLFDRMVQGLRSAASANMHDETTDDVIRQVEAKYPALLFKQQLTAYVEKIYGMMRENLKRELSSLIGLCIQAPRTMEASTQRVSGRLSAHQSQSNHWQKIIEGLDNHLRFLQDNHVPPVLAQKMFTQIFVYINVQIFNSLLLRRECCSFSNGEYVKAGLAELELWCAKAISEYEGASSWDELKHIRQLPQRISSGSYAVPAFTSEANRILSLVLQCHEVLSHMRVLMTEDSNNAESSFFLLDDDSSIPFSVDDIANSMDRKDFSEVKPPEELLANPAFQFLQ